MVIEILIRLLIAMIFALISTLFLAFSFFIMKKNDYIKKNIIVGSLFAGLLFIFSYLPNIIFTIIIAIVVLIIIKYVYIRTWKDTFSAWGIWMGLWILLFFVLSTLIYFSQPIQTLL